MSACSGSQSQHTTHAQAMSGGVSAARGGSRATRPSHKGIDLGSVTKRQLVKCLNEKSGILPDLRAVAADMRIRGHAGMRKPELVERAVGKATGSNGYLRRLKALIA